MRFRDREHAAHLLTERLRAAYKNKHPLVLGVPRGAMPMAKIIAAELGGDLDVVLVHKLGHPDQPELAIGAIGEGGNAILSDWAVEVDPCYINAEKHRQLSTLCDRRARYTPNRAPINAQGRIVIVVDDGIATGSTMMAALRAVRTKNPKKLIGAVAVASPNAARAMLHECDAMVCLNVPADFSAVGEFFDDFTQVSDEDVSEVLRESDQREKRLDLN
jgi:putative phosphoribosyl transferase